MAKDSNPDAHDEAEEEVDDDGAESVDEDNGFVQLPSSDAYKTDAAHSLFDAGITRLIVFGGPQACGKTTLLASLYERLQHGPFGDYKFCWSQTLHGFERVCHEGRDASDLHVPTTLHTSRQSGRLYYDLTLFSETTGIRQRLVFSDLSGEEFEDVRKYDDAVDGLIVIRRADHFPLLVDGKRIADLTDRHQVLDETCTILRALHQNGTLTNSTHVQVVFSKWDLVLSSDEATSGVTYASHVESIITQDFAGMFASLSYARVTARQPAGANAPAEGAEPLLERWVRDRRSSGIQQRASSTGCLRPFDSFEQVRT